MLSWTETAVPTLRNGRLWIEFVSLFFSGEAFFANMHEIREIFLNLLLNAVEAVGTEGKIVVELKYRRDEELIEIVCSDTGKGIPADHLDKVFNPFYTTRHEAVGLGLFVTKQIVHRYGGSIRVESQVGVGSMFILQLPYVAEVMPERESEKTGAAVLDR